MFFNRQARHFESEERELFSRLAAATFAGEPKSAAGVPPALRALELAGRRVAHVQKEEMALEDLLDRGDRP